MTIPPAAPDLSGMLFQTQHDYCLIGLFSYNQDKQYMFEFKNIETAVLLTMLAAHAASYRKFVTKKEATVCKRTLKRLQSEIEHRQKDRPHINVAQIT